MQTLSMLLWTHCLLSPTLDRLLSNRFDVVATIREHFAADRQIAKFGGEVPLLESSRSQESCHTYFTRRVEELGGDDSTIPFNGKTVLPVKESYEEGLLITPGENRASLDITNTSFSPSPFPGF